jgi:prevent-host-death family protein
MKTVDIEDARKQLSRLVARAAKGEPFVIAKAGKPLVKVVALAMPNPKRPKRLGFLSGRLEVPDDFDRIGEMEISRLFEGKSPRRRVRR